MSAVFLALVFGAVTFGVIYFSFRKQTAKLDTIHTLVNSRLSQALDEISDLKETLLAKDIVLAQQREQLGQDERAIREAEARTP